jgi:hypothetical protein
LNNVGEHSVIDWILAASGIAATVACVFVAFYLNRRAVLEDEVQEHSEDIAHIEGHLEATSKYRSRPR